MTPEKTGFTRLATSWGIAFIVDILGIAVVALSTLVPYTAGSAQTLAPSEYHLKAVFLFNFAKFVEWPADGAVNNTGPIVIGVLGDDPFGEDLDRVIMGKTVNNRPLATRRYRSIQDVEGCHILFVSESEKKNLPVIFKQTRNSGILTVGDTENFTQQGGMINFVLEDNKVRFEINVAAALQENLKISSQLLKLARITGGS
jgi:hypothetical protein